MEEEIISALEEIERMEQKKVKYYNEKTKQYLDKYRNNNKEKINAHRREVYKKNMEDPEFVNKRKEIQRRYLQKKKQLLQTTE